MLVNVFRKFTFFTKGVKYGKHELFRDFIIPGGNSMKVFALFLLSLSFVCGGNIEILDLDVITYQDLVSSDPEAMDQMRNALHHKGVIGVRGVPGYREKAKKLIDTARIFYSFPEEVKMQYVPKKGNFLGYGKGVENFKRPDGRWVVDDLKASFYSIIPNVPGNQWPKEIDLETPLRSVASLMSDTAKMIMLEVGMIGETKKIQVDDVRHVSRMLHYKKCGDSHIENPYWCGNHFDHSMLTALLPASYFVDGKQISEPIEAGLFVRKKGGSTYKKVIANDPEVMLFQSGEFGQLATDDAITATEHYVQKAAGNIDRYTLVLFTEPNVDVEIESYSVLTEDSRYNGTAGSPCTYGHWHEASLDRYKVK